MKSIRYLLYVVATVVLVAMSAWLVPEPDFGRVLARNVHPDGECSLDLLSSPYQLDRVYLSMLGPKSNHARIQLSTSIPAEKTMWLTGLEVDVLDAKDQKAISREYFCHSNLTLNPETTTPEKHNQSFTAPTHADWRLFTLVPGRTSMRLPAGFGVPVKNGTLLDNFTMTLNQNPGHPERMVKVKTRVWYRADDSPQAPMRPLFRRALYVYQQHTPTGAKVLAKSSTSAHQGELCGETCRTDQKGAQASTFQAKVRKGLDAHPGATCCVENATPDGIVVQFGRENTVHWMVPPGSHQYTSEVTRQLDLPFDTKAHYVTGHLHPFGKSLKLVDMETGKAVFAIEGRSLRDRLGVEHMSEISSREGVPLHRGRRYQLIAEYENTSQQPIDAMGIMYLYALDEAPSHEGSARSVVATGQ